MHVIALLALPVKATRKIAKMVFTLIAKISAVYLQESISINNFWIVAVNIMHNYIEVISIETQLPSFCEKRNMEITIFPENFQNAIWMMHYSELNIPNGKNNTN